MPLTFFESDLQEGQQVSEHEQSSQWIKVKYSGRKNLCQMCDNVLAKYTCPKCEMKTCSLECTKKHKQVKGCTGERLTVEYVRKEEIDEKVVEKDYNFIEEMISGADKVKKVLSGVNNTISLQPRRFKILRTNAKELYNIRVSNGPNILQRHRDNISFYYVKNKSIFWVFELMYYMGYDEKKGMVISRRLTQPISDEKSFRQILPQDYLDKGLLEQRGINSRKRGQFGVYLQNKQREGECSSRGQGIKQEKRIGSRSNGNIIVSERIHSGRFQVLYQLIEYDVEMVINKKMRDISVFEFPRLFVVQNSLKEEFVKSYRESKMRGKEGGRGKDRGKERDEGVKEGIKERGTQGTNERGTQRTKERGTQRERKRGIERERSRQRNHHNHQQQSDNQKGSRQLQK